MLDQMSHSAKTSLTKAMDDVIQEQERLRLLGANVSAVTESLCAAIIGEVEDPVCLVLDAKDDYGSVVVKQFATKDVWMAKETVETSPATIVIMRMCAARTFLSCALLNEESLPAWEVERKPGCYLAVVVTESGTSFVDVALGEA
jgi:hypothetical protein